MHWAREHRHRGRERQLRHHLRIIVRLRADRPPALGSQVRQSSQAVTCLFGNRGDSWVPCSIRSLLHSPLSFSLPISLSFSLFWFLSLSLQSASAGSVPYHVDIVVSRLTTAASVFHTLYGLCIADEFSLFLSRILYALSVCTLSVFTAHAHIHSVCIYVCVCVPRTPTYLCSRELVKPPPMRGRRRCQRRFALFTRQELVTLRVRGG